MVITLNIFCNIERFDYGGLGRIFMGGFIEKLILLLLYYFIVK